MINFCKLKFNNCEINVAKGEIAHYEQFLLLQNVFKAFKVVCCRCIKSVCLRDMVKSIFLIWANCFIWGNKTITSVTVISKELWVDLPFFELCCKFLVEQAPNDIGLKTVWPKAKLLMIKISPLATMFSSLFNN